MSNVAREELDQRATVIAEQLNGVYPLHEAFYIRSIAYSAGRSDEAFLRFDIARSLQDTADLQVCCIQEALGHAASLSRYFWPSPAGPGSKPLKKLAKVRAANLREAFGMGNASPLRTTKLRNALEHFDERLDTYLLTLEAGIVFPDPLVGQVEMVSEPVGHLFKMVDPGKSQFVLLGEVHSFGDVRKEVERIRDLAMTMDRTGCRLRAQRV